MSFRSKRTFTRFALAATIGMAVMIGCAATGARAADDDDDDSLLDVKILRNVLKHLGLRRDEKAIEYRERSPLVLPPGKELPSPEASTPAKAKTAAWPDDPDVKRAKQKKDAERDRKAYTEGVDDKPLLPGQYDRAPARGSKAGEAPGPTTDETSKPMSQSQLGTKNIFDSLWTPKEEYTTFSGEPPRTTLIEPPAGYRTPSPNQPYGVGREKWKPPAATDRAEPVR